MPIYPVLNGEVMVSLSAVVAKGYYGEVGSLSPSCRTPSRRDYASESSTSRKPLILYDWQNSLTLAHFSSLQTLVTFKLMA
jgi:hypothetical protein